ncbi:hypothetical protein FRB94_010972 [Tulasnella sp. JGI-2019a]|nr:hypothetical protein FRB93_006389 [Tulasnella sp. JGI-2019a]KAG8993170.1 hypothetical protein FRB94_010972 [Tulasnella sp. JGI-2019a]
MSSSGSQQSRSGLSRMKRNWDDRRPTAEEAASSAFPASPEGPTRKRAIISAAAAQPDATGLTAAQRRMRAIQAAIDSTPFVSVNTPSTVAPSSSTRVSSSSTNEEDVFLTSGASADLTMKKRQLPWDSISIRSKVTLSKQQQYVLKQVLEGRNVFFTGSAGTGKSVLLREIISNLRGKYANAQDSIAVTASTGIAACNIGGVTLHSFSGAGICAEEPAQLASKIRKNKKAMTRWLRTNALILDEVSMVEAELFDKLARVAMLLRKNTKPFGGIQIIVTGDFFQLPPVVKNSEPKFAFEAELWPECVDLTFNLTQVFRQKDQDFVDMLNEMRFGGLTDKSIKRFKALSRPIRYDDGIEPTELFPRREDVERANKARMNQLKGKRVVLRSIDGGILTDPQQREKILANFMAPHELDICVDSQVMLIKNMDETLANGSMGRVIGFCDPAIFKGVTTDGKIDTVEETYDATTAAGKKAKERKQRLIDEGKIEECPVVVFKLPGGKLRPEMVQRETFKVELPSGEVQVSRHQFPLILAWAMSIHKSQGQTLDRVKVDLARVFEKGQAYVALSRATSLHGLQVLGFDKAKVLAHPKVTNWSKTLQSTFEKDMDEE